MDRRQPAWTAAACLALLASCGGDRQANEPDRRSGETFDGAAGPVATNPRVVRVAAVNTTISSGLLPSLMPVFEKQTGLRVELIDSEKVTHGKRGRGKRLFVAARGGFADLIIAHYGKADLEPFVSEGYGEFPRLVFANQVALIGPPEDPANIAGMTDAAAALAKIAAAEAPYVANNLDGLKYLSDVLWLAAGSPSKGAWYVRGAERKAKAVRIADTRGGYVLFGVQPFLYFKRKHSSRMEILVWNDPLLQRTMASVVVRPARVPGVNHAGAVALQRFLLSADTQARVKAHRLPGSPHQHWWPVARSNNPALLTGATTGTSASPVPSADAAPTP